MDSLSQIMSAEGHFSKRPGEEESNEPIKGDGFVIMRGDTGPSVYTASDIMVEFRPGETSVKTRAKLEEEFNKGIENLTPEDWAEKSLADMLRYKNPYSETFRIKEDGKFDEEKRYDGSYIYLHAAETPAGLYKLASNIQKKHPEYQFNFETDPEGKWMKYTVSKSKPGK